MPHAGEHRPGHGGPGDGADRRQPGGTGQPRHAAAWPRGSRQDPCRSTISRLAIGSGDPAARAGDHFVVDGVRADRPSPAPSAPPACPARTGSPRHPRRRRRVPGPRSTTNWSMQMRPTLRAPPAVDQHVEATAQRPEHTVGVADRHQRHAWCLLRRSRCDRTTRRRPPEPTSPVQQGISASSPAAGPCRRSSGIGLSPYTAIPGRTMSKARSGRVMVAGELDRCAISKGTP